MDNFILDDSQFQFQAYSYSRGNVIMKELDKYLGYLHADINRGFQSRNVKASLTKEKSMLKAKIS